MTGSRRNRPAHKPGSDKLTDEAKAYITMHYGNGRSARQIARDLGVTRGVVLGAARRLGLNRREPNT